MLTGNIRYRVSGLFKHRLVLQVEVRFYRKVGGTFAAPKGPGRPPEMELTTEWRDARVEDLLNPKLQRQAKEGSVTPGNPGNVPRPVK